MIFLKQGSLFTIALLTHGMNASDTPLTPPVSPYTSSALSCVESRSFSSPFTFNKTNVEDSALTITPENGSCSLTMINKQIASTPYIEKVDQLSPHSFTSMLFIINPQITLTNVSQTAQEVTCYSSHVTFTNYRTVGRSITLNSSESNSLLQQVIIKFLNNHETSCIKGHINFKNSTLDLQILNAAAVTLITKH